MSLELKESDHEGHPLPYEEILILRAVGSHWRVVRFSRSVVSDSLGPHRLQHARLPCPITNSWSLIKFMSIESVMPSNHLILFYPLLLLSFPVSGSFSNESVLCIRWPKYWSFSFSISSSSEHPGLISFRMDWLDLLAVQGTLKSLLQLHSSKLTVLRYSAFFMVHLSHPYMTSGKSFNQMDLGQQVISLLLNMLSRLIITFLPRSKRLLTSWLQSPSADIGAQKNKV